MSLPSLSPVAQQDFARRCHASNVARYNFNQLPKKSVEYCLSLVEKANTEYRERKKANKEHTDNGWGGMHVTPWPRDRNNYILIPATLLIETGCMAEAEATWLGEIRVRETLIQKNRRVGMY